MFFIINLVMATSVGERENTFYLGKAFRKLVIKQLVICILVCMWKPVLQFERHHGLWPIYGLLGQEVD